MKNLRKLPRWLGVCLMLGHGAVEAAEFQTQPCRVLNPLTGITYFDSTIGRNCVAINSQAIDAVTPGSALFIDVSGNQSKVLPLPYGRGGWDILKYSDSELYFESQNPLYLIRINPAFANPSVTRSWEMPSDSVYGWQLARDSNGRVYCGSYPTGKLYRLDPNASFLPLREWGPLGPQENPNGYVRRVAVASSPAGDVVLASLLGGNACNVEVVPGGFLDLDFTQTYPVGDAMATKLVSVGGTVYAQISGSLRLYDPVTKSFTASGLPLPPEGLSWTDIVRTSEPGNLLLRASDSNHYHVDANGSVTRQWRINLKWGTIVGRWRRDSASPWWIVGYRGESWFVHVPDFGGSIIWRRLASEEDIPASSIHFLTDDGVTRVLTGAPPAGQTLFQYDPATGSTMNTDVVSNELGEVYGGVWRQGKFYFATYVGGELSVWNPAEPWDQFNDVNPRLILKYKSSSALKSPTRPRGRVTLGPGLHVYTGWMAGYGKTDGAVTRADVAAESPVIVGWRTHQLLGLLDGEVIQSIGSIVGDSFGVYGMTANKFDGVSNPPTPSETYFFHFDPNTATNQFRRNSFGGFTGVGKVVRVPSTGNIWFYTHTGVYCYHPPTRQIIGSKTWPAGVSNAGSDEEPGEPDAEGICAWFPMYDKIVEVRDHSVGTAFSATIEVRDTVGTEGKYINVVCKSRDGLWSAIGPDLWLSQVPDAGGVPGAPIGVAVKARSYHQMDIFWADTSHNETGFEIERKKDGGSFSLVATVGPDTQSYTDGALAQATYYTYRVRAAGTEGTSACSAEGRTFTKGINLPDWRTHFFGSEDPVGTAADAADPDGDGIANLIEYALGSGPLNPNPSVLPCAEIVGNYLAITFKRPRPAPTGIIYSGEASQNPFTSWQTVPIAPGYPVNNGDGTETVRYIDTVPVGSTTGRYIRLKIAIP